MAASGWKITRKIRANLTLQTIGRPYDPPSCAGLASVGVNLIVQLTTADFHFERRYDQNQWKRCSE